MEDQMTLDTSRIRKRPLWVKLVATIFAIATFYGGIFIWINVVENRKKSESISEVQEKMLFDSIGKYNEGYLKYNGEYVFTHSPEARKSILTALSAQGFKITYQKNGEFKMMVLYRNMRIEITGGPDNMIRKSYSPIEPW